MFNIENFREYSEVVSLLLFNKILLACGTVTETLDLGACYEATGTVVSCSVDGSNANFNSLVRDGSVMIYFTTLFSHNFLTLLQHQHIL